jgi:lipopolysaccharide transport system ATP-binding protein
VLIVDEVLAVGDAGFQRKCMAKMREVSDAGRTILFVSHNMGSIQALCDRAIVLKHGRLVAEGSPAEAAALYLQSTSDETGSLAQRTDRRGRGQARAVDVTAHSRGHDRAPGLLFYGETAFVHCEVDKVVADMSCSLTILNELAQRVCRFQQPHHRGRRRHRRRPALHLRDPGAVARAGPVPRQRGDLLRAGAGR